MRKRSKETSDEKNVSLFFNIEKLFYFDVYAPMIKSIVKSHIVLTLGLDLVQQRFDFGYDMTVKAIATFSIDVLCTIFKVHTYICQQSLSGDTYLHILDMIRKRHEDNKIKLRYVFGEF